MEYVLGAVHLLQTYFSYVWDLLLAVLFTMIGAIYAKKSMNSREIQRVVRELTNIQEEMFQRATNGWKESGIREVRMVGLYFERVKTLKTLLEDNGQTSQKTLGLFDQYERTLRSFAKVWAGTERRRATFWASYAHSFDRYHALIKALDRNFIIENHPLMERLAGKLLNMPQGASPDPNSPKKKGRKRTLPTPSAAGGNSAPASKSA